MQKRQVPGFKRDRIELEPCEICKGRALVAGVFYEVVCTDCNGSGWVVQGTKLVLSVDELVTQLSFKLQQVESEVLALKTPSTPIGPQSQYEQSNRLGAGGTNYTGD